MVNSTTTRLAVPFGSYENVPIIDFTQHTRLQRNNSFVNAVQDNANGEEHRSNYMYDFDMPARKQFAAQPRRAAVERCSPKQQAIKSKHGRCKCAFILSSVFPYRF
ncbi:unnamed protein product [Sphagnum balticum]